METLRELAERWMELSKAKGNCVIAAEAVRNQAVILSEAVPRVLPQALQKAAKTTLDKRRAAFVFERNAASASAAERPEADRVAGLAQAARDEAEFQLSVALLEHFRPSHEVVKLQDCAQP